MTVAELIALLHTFPQDAEVITSMCSDYTRVEPADVTLMAPHDGEGLIDHHGHIMWLPKKWREDNWTRHEVSAAQRRAKVEGPPTLPAEPTFITAVHFTGN